MAIIQYIVIIFFMNGVPFSVFTMDYGTFSNLVGMQDLNISCEKFAAHPNKDAVIATVIKTQKPTGTEVHCLTPSAYSDWILSARNFSNQTSTPQGEKPAGNPGFNNNYSSEKELDEHSSDQVVEFTGKIIQKSNMNSGYQDSYSEFYLEINSGRELAIHPGKDVTRDILLKHLNKRVNVKLQYILQFPTPADAFPKDVDSDGTIRPMPKRFYRVVELIPILY